MKPCPAYLLSIAVLAFGMPAMAQDDEPNAPGSVRSPSDLFQEMPEVRIQLATGREFRGRLQEPQEFLLEITSGTERLAPAALGQIELLDASGSAQLTLRDGNRLRGQLVTPQVTIGMGHGRLSFARGELRLITVSPPATVPREAADDCQRQAPPASDAAPNLDPAAMNAGVTLYTVPDVFSRYPGVSTWHACPLVVGDGYWPRAYFAD